MRESLLFHRLLYSLAFCVASAWFFSNLGRDSFPIGNTITIFSVILSLTLVRVADIKVIFLIAGFVYFSSIKGALDSNYFINFSYKILSFLPVIILVKRAPIDLVYKAVLHSFMSSTLIAISLLILGYSASKFIIYDDFIPRFAGLAIEPVSFALGSVVLFVFYLLRFRSASVFVSTLFYIPILAAVSGIILIKITIDFLNKVKLRYFFGVF